ncbi:MAG: AAA family ATPase [Betaproteobacteria bacterium]|nr:AAA family ATPase [Betaproteobacteria bacterium]
MHADIETYSASLDEYVGHKENQWCVGANRANAPMHQDDEAILPPVIVDAAALLARTFKPRVHLLSPWLTTQSLTMIYARRGVGKTHMALGVAYALASGGEFIGWKATQPVRVLYLDGEMPGADLKDRLARIITNSALEAPAGYLQIMTPDVQPFGMLPNLYDREGQRAIDAVIGEAQVIIVDNLSCLVRGGKENEGESWQPVAEWALRMRSAGRSVIFIHHAGKGGQQRGTSKREDLLDTVISLRRPSDYTPDQGARFEVHFEKARALYGEDVDPIDARLETLPDGKQAWAIQRVSDSTDEQIVEMTDMGMTTREIGTELGVTHSTIVRALARLKESGRYTPKAKAPRKPREPAPHWSDGHD